MPFRRLRSLEEAEEAVWLDRDDPRLPERIRGVWDLGFRLAPRRFAPGVYKFRSIEEKNRFDEEQRQAHVDAQRERLRSGSR